MEDQQTGGGSHKIGGDGAAEKINILVVDTVSRPSPVIAASLLVFCSFVSHANNFLFHWQDTGDLLAYTILRHRKMRSLMERHAMERKFNTQDIIFRTKDCQQVILPSHTPLDLKLNHEDKILCSQKPKDDVIVAISGEGTSRKVSQVEYSEYIFADPW